MQAYLRNFDMSTICIQDLENLHDLVLRHTSGLFLALHHIARILIFDICKPERTSAILIAGKFCWQKISCNDSKIDLEYHTDGSLGILTCVKLDNTSATGTTVRFVLNFGAFDCSNCRE